MEMKVKRLHENAVIPQYKTHGAAGFDFHAIEMTCINPGFTAVVPLGLAFEVPEGYELNLRGRSGMSTKCNYFVKEGTVDSDYRGEVGLIIHNPSLDEPLYIEAGDRIGQGVISAVARVEIQEANDLGETKRGAGGFGHTGV